MRCRGCGVIFEPYFAYPTLPLCCTRCGSGTLDVWDLADDSDNGTYIIEDHDIDGFRWFERFAPMRHAQHRARQPFATADGVYPVAWRRKQGWTLDHYSRDFRMALCGAVIPTGYPALEFSYIEFGTPCSICWKKATRMVKPD